MNINELRGSRIKKDMKALRVRKTFHNKHKDGSGNFGFILVLKDNSPNAYRGESWFAFNGIYDTEGIITRLQCGDYASLGTTHEVQPITYENFLATLRQVLKEHGF